MSSRALTKAAHEVSATKSELDASIIAFEAATYRGDSKRLGLATEAAHAALQAHLDAKAAIWAVAKRDFPA